MSAKLEEILFHLKSLSNEENRQGMARYGINIDKAFGVSIPTLRGLAKELGKDHSLAQELWESGFHEARILASYVEDPAQVTEAQMESWVADFDSWDTCDQVTDLFERTPFGYQKAIEWSTRKEEFVKRAGFALMAGLSVHDKKADDSQFEQFFPIILGESTDERNFVKKAVNWALRNIGKRNLALNAKAIKVAEKMAQIDSKSARWNAKDALRELRSEKIRERMRKKAEKA